jgi:hypothetical protein
LKKLCNHPSLLYPYEKEKRVATSKKTTPKKEEEVETDEEEAPEQEMAKSFLKPYFPDDFKVDKHQAEFSGGLVVRLPNTIGKLLILDNLLLQIKSETKDKVILVSFFQQVCINPLLLTCHPSDPRCVTADVRGAEVQIPPTRWNNKH